MIDPSCPFCKIVIGEAPATVVGDLRNSIVIVPLNPVVPGHVLVIPREHTPDFAARVNVTADAMYDAAYYAANHQSYKQCNLITSRGEAATQTVFHFHIHLVPRQDGDKLMLPWTDQFWQRKAWDTYMEIGEL